MTDDTQDQPAPAPDQVIARVQATLPRRVVGAAMLAILGGLLVYIALVTPPEILFWQGFLIVLGGVVLWLSWRLWLATETALELTPTELREASGRRLAALSEIEGISRGVFAFKPSNGFLLTLRNPGPAAWAPGLWWRTGRRIGVGGVTPRHATRQMAEILDMELARHKAAAANRD